MLNEAEQIYTAIGSREQWKKHIDHLTTMVKDSFQTYCQTSQQFRHLTQVKTQLETWVGEYDRLVSLCKHHGKDKGSETVADQLGQLALRKFNNDQLFMANLMQSLEIEAVRHKMESAGRIFQLHHQLVQDIVQPLIAPNICKICVLHEANRFIDVCGHIICESCSDKLFDSGDHMYGHAMINHSRSATCPWCNATFAKNNLRKIFY